jgi:RimJ/RimL family protein N-acetyltransferase
VGVSKPHTRIFQLTLDRLGAQPHEAVHVGDLTHSDIAGAKAIGMYAVRLTANYDDANRSVEADAVVNSYAEFEAWLKSKAAPGDPPRSERGHGQGMKGIPSLETTRLLLRPFAANDLDDYTRLIFADAEVMRYLPQRDLAPRDRAERTIAVFTERWGENHFGVWAVTDKVTGEFIGHCGLGPVPEAGEIEVLYALGQAYWGRGIATEAARASVHFGFEQANLDRLIALAVPENIASRRVMEHLGFAYEKDAQYFGLDLVQYTLHRHHFHGIVAH